MKKSFYSFLLVAVFQLILLNTVSADIRMLYTTNFQDWTAVSNPTTELSINKTTSFTNETLTFKLLGVSVIPDKYDATKFNYNIVSTGALMAEKMSSATDPCYIETSALKSITKIFVNIGATGSNRGFKIQKKADGDADWVDILTTVANPANGDSTTIAIPGSKTNVALRFSNLAYSQNAYLLDLQIYGEYISTTPQKNLKTSVNIAQAGVIVKNPIALTYDENSTVSLQANRNFGYAFVSWVDSLSQTVLSVENPFNLTMDGDKNIQAVFRAINTYELKLDVQGGAKDYMIAVSPKPTMVDSKKMYEEGTNVTLTAENNPIFTFNNWGTGETNAVLPLTMSSDKTISAVYSGVDFIAGWDFYNSGNSTRPADFYGTADNQTSTLILQNSTGTVVSWLDKSQVSASGYEGKPAAVNWTPLANKNYYQISFNATDFTDITVSSSMLLNYNAYSVQNIEYSIDGTNFSKIDVITLSTPKLWYSKTVALPADANHVAKVYIRWIPDYNSAVVGASATNDGTAISEIYVYGKVNIQNDGVAPVLVSSIPTANGTGASTTGKIVLTFDEKVQTANGTMAYLNSKLISPTVSGKTITFAYSGLDYNTEYTFSLGENNISDLGGNTINTKIEFKFTTMNRPVVSKKLFDFVVGVDGDFKAALQAAQAAQGSGNRFYIFFPNGEYNIGSVTGDANQMTSVSVPNLSIIGQSSDNVVLYNKSIQEAINSTATLYFTSASNNNYVQDISLMNKMDYRTGTLIGRGVALWDQGNKNIYKGIKLLSNQDTYYSGNTIRSYFENSEIHGTVDFLCGGGDVFFNECLIYLEERSGNCISAPATSTDWGYVFNSCTIDGFSVNNGTYRLARPWSNAPKAVYLNTTMKVLPTAAAWGDPMNVVPAVFAEYNSMTSNGSVVDLSSRRTTFTKDATTVTLNPVLSAAQAANYTIENVLGGTDAWQPKLYTDQTAAPVISKNGNNIEWENNNYTLCWAIFKNNEFVSFVTNNSFEIPANTASGSLFTVRAANEMGGLGATSNALEYQPTALSFPVENAQVISEKYFTINGVEIKNLKGYKGSVIIRSVYSNGRVTVNKIFKTN